MPITCTLLNAEFCADFKNVYLYLLIMNISEETANFVSKSLILTFKQNLVVFDTELVVSSAIIMIRDVVCKNRAVFGIFGSDGLKKSLFFVMW